MFPRADLIDSDNIRCRWQNQSETKECRFDCFDPVIDMGPGLRTVGARRADSRAVLRALYRRRGPPVQGQADFQAAGSDGLRICTRTTSAGRISRELYDGDRGDRSERTRATARRRCFPAIISGGCMSPRTACITSCRRAVDVVAAWCSIWEPGDIAMFGGFTPHRSGPIAPIAGGGIAYLSYNAARDGGDQREPHYRQFHAWLKDRYAEYGKTNIYFLDRSGDDDRSRCCRPEIPRVAQCEQPGTGAVAFYRVLLGRDAAKQRADYAKFELDDPPLVLSLIPSHGGGGAAI